MANGVGVEEKLRLIEEAKVVWTVENVMDIRTDGIRNRRSIETAIDPVSLDLCHFQGKYSRFGAQVSTGRVLESSRKILDCPGELKMNPST